MLHTPVYFPRAALKDIQPLTIRVAVGTVVQALKGLSPKAALALDDDYSRLIPARILAGVASVSNAEALELTEIEVGEGKKGLQVRPINAPLFSRQTIRYVNWAYPNPIHRIIFADKPAPGKPSKAEKWVEKATLKIGPKKRYENRDELHRAYRYGDIACDGKRLHADLSLTSGAPQDFITEVMAMFDGEEEWSVKEKERIFNAASNWDARMRQLLEDAQKGYAKVIYPSNALAQALKPYAKFSEFVLLILDGETTRLWAQSDDLNISETDVPHVGHMPRTVLTLNAKHVYEAVDGMAGDLELRFQGTHFGANIAFHDTQQKWGLVVQCEPHKDWPK